ncbi:phosphoglycerate mutase [Blastomyces gilchristii SLH14081]|uniref:Phosphoglycerate mutase n=1 Tax=Blastomyces gilchristii (strain SLH14081) TaxID=559298 RepID=A0A179UYK0_BLAGS|nr:phosphoglycerate mutase [Blastomyces gilchristii SLH14081]OAT12121.1 phosphoglycerate mutase [Blastomyces gilchristii SLH14081]
MPLDRIYLTRHGHRLNWTIDLSTGTYHSMYPTPTGIPVDPILTGPGVRQSHELAAHINSDEFFPRPCRVYSSPFYRCLQTIQPTVEVLKARQELEQKPYVDLNVRVENGLGEWFGSSSSFAHPAPASPEVLQTHFPTLLTSSSSSDIEANSTSPHANYKPHIYPSPNGENIAGLHDRIATTLEAIIAQVDAELEAYERENPSEAKQSHAILICTHAAPLIAMGRALTGDMPEDTCVEDFRPFTASLSTFVRRSGRGGGDGDGNRDRDRDRDRYGEGSDVKMISGKKVPRWQGGVGVGGGWDCVGNGECGFLSGGKERGWHFNGEEDFDTTPAAAVVTEAECSPAKL